jgi:Ni/Co efflux regulator RcnB
MVPWKIADQASPRMAHEEFIMKKLVFGLLAAATLGTAVPAFAQGPRPSDWRPLAQRQDNIERRIDQGVRSGQLTRREARSLHEQFRSLLRLEDRYRRHGLTVRERADLQRRYDSLASRVRFEKHDFQRR